METGAHVDAEPEQLNMETDCSHSLHGRQEALWCEWAAVI